MAAAEDTAMAGVSQQQHYAPSAPAPPPPPVAAPHAPVGPAAGAEFFLSNYRLGKTLGIGSFGKVRGRRGGGGGRAANRDGLLRLAAAGPGSLFVKGAARGPGVTGSVLALMRACSHGIVRHA